jgi:hypothetical protein
MNLSFLPRLQYDNANINGSGGVIKVASDTDPVSSAEWQIIKILFGGDGVNEGLVAKNNGLPIQGAQTGLTSASWTSATALNTAATLAITNLNTVTVGIVTTSTFTGGVVSFEVSPDGTNWFIIQMCRIDAYTTEATYAFVASTLRAWSTSVDGFTQFRVRLSTVITGTGTATILITGQVFAVEPIVTIGQSNAANLQATVTQQALTKGTQGANGVMTQALKDSGRVAICLTAEFTFAQVAETLLSMTESRDGGATATFTSKVITTGKRLRIVAIYLEIETLGTGTTPQRMYLRLRVNTAGATTTASPIQGVWSIVNATAVVKSGNSDSYVIPDGVEYAGDGTKTYGFTLETPDWVTTTATGRAKITIIAFEY